MVECKGSEVGVGGGHVNANNTCKVFSIKKKKREDEGEVTVGSED